MLKKLLKYDLKYMYKTLSIFYLITIVSAIFTALLKLVDGWFIFDVLSFVTSFVTVVMVILIVGYNVLKAWARFLNNIYKDESYLTHTLPVSERAIFSSKFLSAAITLLSSFLIIVVALFIAFYSREILDFIKTALDGLANANNSSVVFFTIIIADIVFLEVLATVMAGYTGILLGYKCNNNKLVMSIVIGYIISMVFSLLILAIVFLIGLIFPDIMDIIVYNNTPTVETIKILLGASCVAYLLELCIYFLLDLHILKRGVNVE